jgi:hypothetical protein
MVLMKCIEFCISELFIDRSVNSIDWFVNDLIECNSIDWFVNDLIECIEFCISEPFTDRTLIA